jgi:8-oxo-dGTP pyrophosphatase MutT (NUDIX family)
MQKLSSRIVTGNPLFEVQLHDVQFPDGHVIRDYLYLRVNPGVMIVALTTNSELIFLEQYRYAVNETVLCLPGGLADTPTEDLLAVAKRELEEETGFTAEQYEFVGETYPLPGNNTNRTNVYVAMNCRPNGHFNPESSENVHVRIVPLAELSAMLQVNAIKDSLTLSSILLAQPKLQPISVIEKE